MSLDGVKWGEFVISDVAEIISGRGIFDAERKPGNIPYITSSAMNNGVTYFLSNINDTLEANCISVNSNGSVGYAFYHPYEALYSGDCRKLRPYRRSKYAALFIAAVITAQREKYSYGYKMGTARLIRQKILLPVNDSGQPDYDFMERFIHAHEQRLIRKYVEHISERVRDYELLTLDGIKWSKFAIGDLFTIEQGKCSRANELTRSHAEIPYLGATNRNNGVLDFVNADEKLMQKGNCIAFIKDGEGSMGYSVYKAENFIATTNMALGYAPFLDRYTGMFITTVADKVRGKYSYNYKRNEERLKKEMIQLPIDSSGLPDWQFMHDFMLSLEQHHLSLVLAHFSKKLAGNA